MGVYWECGFDDGWKISSDDGWKISSDRVARPCADYARPERENSARSKAFGMAAGEVFDSAEMHNDQRHNN